MVKSFFAPTMGEAGKAAPDFCCVTMILEDMWTCQEPALAFM